MLENKLGIADSVELAREEERISKQKAREMYMKGIGHSYYYEGYTVYKMNEL